MTHKQAVLRLLSDRKPHSHHELYGLGCVAHSRISDLRRDGYRIEQWREDGLYLYQLKGRALAEAAVSSPPAEQSPPSAPVAAASASVSTPNPAAHDESTADAPASRDEAGTLLLFECKIDESAGLRGAYGDAA